MVKFSKFFGIIRPVKPGSSVWVEAPAFKERALCQIRQAVVSFLTSLFVVSISRGTVRGRRSCRLAAGVILLMALCLCSQSISSADIRPDRAALILEPDSELPAAVDCFDTGDAAFHSEMHQLRDMAQATILLPTVSLNLSSFKPETVTPSVETSDRDKSAVRLILWLFGGLIVLTIIMIVVVIAVLKKFKRLS